jgi:hypothetical protein
MCSLDVHFSVECVFNVIFEFLTLKMISKTHLTHVECVFNVVFDTEKDIENAFDSETHIQTTHQKRKCNRPLSRNTTPYSPLIGTYF